MYRFKIPDRFAPPPTRRTQSLHRCCSLLLYLLRCRWTEYAPFGETVAGTKIIAVKTPLEQVSRLANGGSARASI